MGLGLLRIDDRMIHGQVVIGWAQPLKAKRLILCDDEVSKNEWERELYLSCVSPEIESAVMTIQQCVELLKRGGPDLASTFIIIKSPQVLNDLVKHGYTPETVNIGGLHYSEGKKEYLSYLFLSDFEKELLKKLMGRNIRIFCQDLPNSKKHELSALIS